MWVIIFDILYTYPKLDLREWAPKHEKLGKVVMLTVEEVQV